MNVLFNRISEFVDTFQKEYQIGFEYKNGQLTLSLQSNGIKQLKVFYASEVISSQTNILLLNWGK